MLAKWTSGLNLHRWRSRYLSWLPDGIQIVLISALLVSGLTIAGRRWSGIEGLELRVLDRFIQATSQPPLPATERQGTRLDSPVIVVGITEADLRQLNRTTPSDQDLAQVLQQLQQFEPVAIGVDLHRELPQGEGREALLAELTRENIYAITLLGFSEETRIPAPAVVPPDRVGFNDFVVDLDGVVRRNLLFGSVPDEGTFYSFALQLAIAYLAEQDIQPVGSAQNPAWMQLGAATFVPLQSGSGGYSQVDAGGYQILMNYQGLPDTIPQLSFTQVLSGDFDPAAIRDRVVVIGTVAASSRDFFLTPFSAAAGKELKMAGVTLHAQMVTQFIDAAQGDRPLFTFWPNWVEAGWIFGWAVASSAIAWRVKYAAVWGILTGLGLVGLVATSYLLFLGSIWIPVVAPAIALGVSGGTTVAYRAQRALRQHQMIMTLLGQNTSPEIAKALWSNRDELIDSGKLPGKSLTATILFSDLQNFSTIAEQQSPQDLLNWLNEYLSLMTAEVQCHGGIVNKFTGDGLMAVFGVPVERTNPEAIAQDAQHAVQCAVKMADHLRTLNQQWSDRQLPQVKMRVGIYTGQVVAGSLGGKDRLEYGVIGDSVNVASRLESCEKERHQGLCRILITDQTLQYLDDTVRVDDWGLISLKGRVQPAQVYQVLAIDPVARPLNPSAIATETPDLDPSQSPC